MPELGTQWNDLDTRLAELEQYAVRPVTGATDVVTDDVGTTIVADPLDWTVAANGWETYSQISAVITDPDDPNYPGMISNTDYGMAAASLLGSNCLLTGMVRRKTGAANLVAGTRYNLPMFGLAVNWRPVHNVLLPCLMGNTDPAGLGVVGMAWIEIRPDLDVLAPSGRVYFIAGTVGCAAGTGWVALQGIFPCQITDGATPIVEDSWDDASETISWDQMADDVTWNSYPYSA